MRFARTTSLLLLLAAVVTVGCSSNDPPAEEPSPNTFPQCEESDFSAGAFAGPGYDPDTGLVAPLQDDYLVATTAVVVAEGKNQRFFQLAGAIIGALDGVDGLIGTSVATSTVCGTARTLTAWRDEEAMFNFVVSDLHVAAVAETGEVTSAAATTSYTVAADAFPPSWDVAAERVAAVPVH